MKKYVAIVLLLCMIFTLTACGAPKATEEKPAAEETTGTEAPAEVPADTTAEEAEYKMGMGVSVSTDSTEDLNAQVDATAAAVVLDAEGKIVACRIDCAQSKMDVTDGAADTAMTFKTKMELGDDYNMVKFSDATNEWDAQAMAFEAYVVGKTGDEVAAMETEVNEEGHNVTTDETLYASCSISIEDFIDAVVKACNDEKGTTFTSAGEFTLGLAAITTADESTAATAEEAGVAKLYTEFGAAVKDADGMILAALTDAIQPQISFDTAGVITDTVFKGTKRELGADYNMVTYGNAIAEWDAQAKAFADYTVGKTADEVRAIETETNEEGHDVSTDETLLASCTMSISGMMAVIAQAADYAR